MMPPHGRAGHLWLAHRLTASYTASHGPHMLTCSHTATHMPNCLLPLLPHQSLTSPCLHLPPPPLPPRWFGGAQVSAALWDGVTNYLVKVKESAEEQQARLDAFARELEGKAPAKKEDEEGLDADADEAMPDS